MHHPTKVLLLLLASTAGCATDPALEPELDDVVDVDDTSPGEAAPLSGTAKPADVVCDGTLCWDQEWHACGGYNYRGRVYLSRTNGVYEPYYASVTQYTGDRNRTVGGLDWRIWLYNDSGLLGATTYHDDDDSEFGTLSLYNFDPSRASHPYVEFLAGKSEDHKGSCRFRIYLYGAG